MNCFLLTFSTLLQINFNLVQLKGQFICESTRTLYLNIQLVTKLNRPL